MKMTRNDSLCVIFFLIYHNYDTNTPKLIQMYDLIPIIQF